MPRNIELKVPFELTQSRQDALAQLGAQRIADLLQTDTYFHCPAGRLKLREMVERPDVGGPRAELIAYRRPDDAGLRGSRYEVHPVMDPASLKAALSLTLGVRGVVVKERELFIWRNVRIHLDRVTDLGTFLELEAVVDPVPRPAGAAELADAASEVQSRERLTALITVLAIDPSQAIAGSYVDLLQQRAVRS